MKRDIANITRVLDDVKNNDIIYKKSVIKDIFNADPDLKEVLGQLDKIPLNKYADREHPTEEEIKERQRIVEYNEKVSHPQILSFLKVNDIQTEVLNFVMFDIEDERQSYTNDLIKHQLVTVLLLVHENDMDTEYGVDRIDLLSYIVEDLLCWSNDTGLHMKLIENKFGITDTKYYSRTLKFLIKATNTNNFRRGRMSNSHEQV